MLPARRIDRGAHVPPIRLHSSRSAVARHEFLDTENQRDADLTGPSLLTPEEVRQVERLAKRREKGEFINLFEDPVNRRKLKESIERGSELLPGANRTNLGSFAEKLGLPPETTDKLLLHASRVNEAAIEVQAMLVQLEPARAEYERRVRSSMTEQQLEAYREFEMMQPARRELDAIRQFATARDLPVNANEEASLLTVIREAEAYTTARYLGPYDGLPEVAVGKDQVVENSRHQLEQLEQALQRITHLADQRGLSDSSHTLLRFYLEDIMMSRNAEIETILNPSTEAQMRSELMQRVEDDLRAAQHSELAGDQGKGDRNQ